ncbi:O-antigen ligase family protein [Rhodococcus sp. NPDC003318]|uniref:O-antigen ligase family protein n=1 Tax=Rhodococcus sp. NPDC003318 TaxID=3364503 RepID=UPI0036B4F7CA
MNQKVLNNNRTDTPTISPGGTIWVAILAITPIYRLISIEVSPLITYAILAVVISCALLGRLSPPPKSGIWIFALLATPIAALISGASSSVSMSTSAGIKLAILIGITPFVVRYYAESECNFVKYSTIAFTTVQSVSAAAGLFQLAGVSMLGREANDGRANGLAVHPNVLGIMAVITILACFYMQPKLKGKTRALCIAAIALNFGALIGSGSLSSMISLTVGGAVLLISMRVTVRTAIKTAVAATIVAAISIVCGYNPSSFKDPIEGRVDTVLGLSDGVASVSIRESTYDYAITHITSDPLFGVGMDPTNEGTFDGVTVVHNYLLRSWYQGGLLLFIVFLAITAVLITMVARSLISGMNAPQSAVIAAVIGFAITSAFYDQQQYWIPLIFAVAFSSLPNHYETTTNTEAQSAVSSI